MKEADGRDPNSRVDAGNGIEHASRDVGDGAVPPVLLQHFRGNLENWDPPWSTRSPPTAAADRGRLTLPSFE